MCLGFGRNYLVALPCVFFCTCCLVPNMPAPLYLEAHTSCTQHVSNTMSNLTDADIARKII